MLLTSNPLVHRLPSAVDAVRAAHRAKVPAGLDALCWLMSVACEAPPPSVPIADFNAWLRTGDAEMTAWIGYFMARLGPRLNPFLRDLCHPEVFVGLAAVGDDERSVGQSDALTVFLAGLDRIREPTWPEALAAPPFPR